MDISTLLNAIPHVRFTQGTAAYRRRNLEQSPWAVRTVRALDDTLDDVHALRWATAANIEQARAVTAGFLIVPPQATEEELLKLPSACDIFECEDPKASIIAAINVLYPDWWRAQYVPLPCGSAIVEGAELLDTVRIACHTIIGGEGFGFHRPPASEAGQPTTDNRQPPTRFPHIGSVKLGARVEVGSNTCIDRGAIGDTIIGDDTKIDNLVHIAHNVRIGQRCLIVAGAVIGGSAIIGDDVFIGINASIKNKVRIGNGAVIGMGAVVTKDVPAGETWVGNPAHKLAPKAKAGCTVQPMQA